MPPTDSPKKERSNLASRLLASVVIVPGLGILFYLDHAVFGAKAIVLWAFLMALGLRSAWEMCDLLNTRSFRMNRPLVLVCVGIVISSSWYAPLTAEDPNAIACGAALGPTAIAFTFSVIALLLAGAARYERPGHSMETFGAELMTVAYVGLLFAVTAQLRWVAGVEAGYLVIAAMIVPTKSGDIGAYTFGRLFGKRKMAPVLSPGKTWAGAVGAVVFSAAAGFLWLRFGTGLFDSSWESPAWYLTILFGAAMGVSGLLGDLCESLIKRDCGKKDAAAILPGFGGALDLVDSPLFAGPVAYLLWTLLPLATWL